MPAPLDHHQHDLRPVLLAAVRSAGVAFSADDKEHRVIADKYDGKRFNAPNDLVLDKAGGVYFTEGVPAKRAAYRPAGSVVAEEPLQACDV